MRTKLTLREGWHVRELEPGEHDVAALTREVALPERNWLPAAMPAQVHDVLLRHGLIGDPRVGKNAADCAWVAERNWAYGCTFAAPPGGEGPMLLRFGGLDTLAAAYLNGVHVGSFDNMFREHVVDVQEQLRPPGHEDVLLVIFSSPSRFVSQVNQPPGQADAVARHKYLRKSLSDFSSYLGARPHAVKVGIYRDVVLDVPDRAWIEDVWVRSELSPGLNQATVRAHVDVAGDAASLGWALTDPSGSRMASGSEASCGAGVDIQIELEDAKLWWPRTHGAPHLYRLDVDLSLDGERLDSRRVSFGIRDVRAVLADPETGEKRFKFVVNGRPIFLRGACSAPLEGMTHCWRPERAAKLLDMAEHARMNALRVWGGGHLPPQEFYDECDRRGLLVWQDFMFGYGMYPDGDAAFDDNCRVEIEGTIRALRNHPCVLLWVGGNENQMGWDFQIGGEPTVGRALFERVMPETCARLDPTRIFHTSSPYGGRAPNWPLEGDWHDYTTVTFSHEASVPLFASEVGRASPPSLRSMRRFLEQEEIWPEGHDPAIRTPARPAWPPMWQYRSVDGSWDKIGHIEEFCDPSCAEDLIRILGTAHGEYLQRRIERHRRGVPDGAPAAHRRCWGNMVWRLNDSWPITYWSVVDYYLEPKIAYYFLRRAYAPVLVCFERTRDRLAVWVVNDSPEAVQGALTVRRMRFDGTVRGRLEADVAVEPGAAQRCIETVDLGPISLRDEFLHAEFAGRSVTHLLTGERYLHLPHADLAARCVGGRIEVATDVFARQVALEMADAPGAVLEDNYFDMPPGQRRTVAVIDPAEGSRLTVRACNSDPVAVQL